MDPRIRNRIHPKISWIRNTGGVGLKITVFCIRTRIDLALLEMDPLLFSTRSTYIFNKKNFTFCDSSKTEQDPKPDPQGKNWIQIHTGTKADPQHWKILKFFVSSDSIFFCTGTGTCSKNF
jgi:hypothetical protein